VGAGCAVSAGSEEDRATPRTTNLRDVWDATLYMASTGCQWAMIPNDFPPPSTVQRYFYDWRDSGLLRTINHHLVMEARELEGREVSPMGQRRQIPSLKQRCRTTKPAGLFASHYGKGCSSLGSGTMIRLP